MKTLSKTLTTKFRKKLRELGWSVADTAKIIETLRRHYSYNRDNLAAGELWLGVDEDGIVRFTNDYLYRYTPEMLLRE